MSQATPARSRKAPPPKTPVSDQDIHLIEMLDETMARLDKGITEQRSALDALLTRMTKQAA